jgi:hypothetical protein
VVAVLHFRDDAVVPHEEGGGTVAQRLLELSRRGPHPGVGDEHQDPARRSGVDSVEGGCESGRPHPQRAGEVRRSHVSGQVERGGGYGRAQLLLVGQGSRGEENGVDLRR